jgi:predicted extracellular nuclease
MTRTMAKVFAIALSLAMVFSFLPLSRVPAATTAVFFNEIHYDNTGTDTGEAIEVAGPAGTDLSGWGIVLYNGNGGAPYDTTSLSGTIPDLGGGFGVVVISYPSNGIQNGSPDGMALVDASSTVIQFLSYEGTFTALGGPADGLTSTDIGVFENGSGPVGDSLQLTGTGTVYEDFTWAADAPNTFGAFNNGQTFSSVPVTTDPAGLGVATPNALLAGESTLLTVAVTPGTNPTSTGLTVSCDLSAIGGSSTQALYDDGTNGDVTGGDNTFSFSATVDGSTSPGGKSLACTITDAEARSGSASIALTVAAPTTFGVVISQVYGGGGNSGATLKNDFIELYNLGSTAVDLTGWSVQYGSSGGNTWNNRTNLSGTIQPGKYFLIQEAAGGGGTVDLPTPNVSGNINMSGTNGKVALVNSTTALSGACPSDITIVDFVGYGSANCSETSPTPSLSNSTAALRNGNGSVDTDNNLADFTVGAPNPRNSNYPFTATGLATPSATVPGGTTLLTVSVTPGTDPASTGIAVSCNLSSIGGLATQTLFDDGTNGDVTAGDNVFSFSTTATGTGTQYLGCTFTDAQGRRDETSISITFLVVVPIGTVNGPVADTDDGTLHRSPYAPASGNGTGTEIVVVQGVVYEKTLQAISGSTNSYKGLFLQNTAATADADPNTSDGIFVFMSTYGNISIPGGGYYVPQVGDELVLAGRVSEYYNMTELQSLTLLKIVRTGVDIDAEIAPIVADPPVSLADANRYWERLQGMRVQVPQDSLVLGGRNVFSPADAEIWVANPDSTIAQRTDLYTNRAFRDAHPLDDNYDPNNWDGNGYRILMGSLGIKYTASDAQALIDPARTFDTVTNAPAGGLNYTFSKYRIEISEQPTFNLGPDPAQNNPPTAIADRTGAYSIADYNLENLYDYRNNPFSGCDFAGDTGCAQVAPFISGVTPPYDYVPASEAVYQARLNDISLEIINDLHSPDILMVQEVENQDICVVDMGALDCGTTDNADGKPDVLQELALKIAANGGPAYDAAFDRDSSDLRGIAPAFLYRTDRVQLVSPVGDPVLGTNPAIAYAGAPVPADGDVSNPKTFNAVLPSGVSACETSWVFPRAPDVGLFRIYSDSIGVGSYRDVYVIDNHFKSGPDSCVAHRTEQAKYNAALVAFIEAANPTARIVVGGDLNVYPEPDNTSLGAPEQLGSLYDPALGLKNLWEVLLDQAPEAAYSYVYVGMAQTLDQMFINQTMLNDLREFRIAHINSDFPADYSGDVARGTSDHDPNVATFDINFEGFFPPIDNLPALNVAKAGSSIPVKFSLGGNKGLDIFAAGYPLSMKIDCNTGASLGDVKETVNPGGSGLHYGSGQYNYVWKTEKAWAGTCRQLVVKLTDGTVQTANFKFK